MKATSDNVATVGQLYKEAFASRVPISCNLELTRRCNFRCPHCYASPHVGELQVDRALHDIRQLSDLGCLYYTLTGGEAILHPDFEEICLEIKRHIGVITLFSNGFFLDEKLDFLKRIRPQAVDVTIYGSSDEAYEAFCGVHGGYKRVLANIKAALSVGLNITLKMFVTRDNYSDFPAVRQLAANLGLPFRFDSELFPTFGGDVSLINQSISVEESLLMDLSSNNGNPADWFDRGRRSSCDDPSIVSEWHSLQNLTCAGKVFRCKAGRSSMFVTSENMARMCYMIPSIEYNLNEMTLKNAWAGFEKQILLEENPESECAKCLDREFCHVCPARLFHANGKIDSIEGDSRCCAIMHAKRRIKSLS